LEWVVVGFGLFLKKCLSPQNILMEGDRGILSDFDVSLDHSFFDSTMTQSMAPGTLNYMAPELFEAGAKISMASDMYSFGVLIFLAHFSEKTVYMPPGAAHATVPADRDVSLRLLLESLLSRDPDGRPSADEVLAMDYFSRTITESDDERAATTALEIFREMLRLNKMSKGQAFPVRCKLNAGLDFVPESLRLFGTLRNSTKPLRVKFVGEKAMDSGGVTTSLYRRFFNEVLQRPGLFERRGGSTFLPSVRAPLDAMLAFGIALSRCIFDERVVELPIASSVYKFLMDKKLDFNDLETFDETQALSLKQILRLPGVESLGLSFEYCGGASTPVHDLNKEGMPVETFVFLST
jgi:hypothetical protein